MFVKDERDLRRRAPNGHVYNLKIRRNWGMVINDHRAGVRVTSAHIFSDTHSNIFVVRPYVGLFTVFEQNYLVAFGIGFHNFWDCAVGVPLVCIVAVYKR